MRKQSSACLALLAGLILALAGCGETAVEEYSLYSSSWGLDSLNIIYFEGKTTGRSKPVFLASELTTDTVTIALKQAQISGTTIVSDTIVKQFASDENPIPSALGYSQKYKAVFYSRASDGIFYLMKYDLSLKVETQFVPLTFQAVQIQVSPDGEMLGITEPTAIDNLISRVRVFNLATGTEIYTMPDYSAYGALLWIASTKLAYQVDPNQVATQGAVHTIDLAVTPPVDRQADNQAVDPQSDTIGDLSTAVRNYVHSTLSPDGNWLFVLDSLHEAKIVSAR